MTRVPAILLVFVIGFSPIAPALFSDAAAHLPACCRRDGKHHCGMTGQEMADMAGTPSSGLAADASRAKCPFFPSGGVLLPHSGAALLSASQTVGISTARQVARQAQADAGYRIAFDSSHQKRGPPNFSL
ncbi:MAG: hypothetical protein ABSG65_34465 [Bryobacteraceae bacterium]